jgi:hemerythrin-like domain-containing protein
MQTLRFNAFNQIHKGLRALLYDTALLIQHTDFTNEQETAAVINQVQLVNKMFGHHAHIEDNMVFPLLNDYAPEVVADFEKQHQTDHQLSEGLERCLALFNETNSEVQNTWAGNELLQSFNAFLAFNVEHMKNEETIINSILWKHYTDAQLLQKVQEIGASIPPDENAVHASWMLKGLASHEIIQWLTGVRLGAPAPVFEGLCAVAEKVLPAAKWNTIQAALQLNTVPA